MECAVSPGACWALTLEHAVCCAGSGASCVLTPERAVCCAASRSCCALTPERAVCCAASGVCGALDALEGMVPARATWVQCVCCIEGVLGQIESGSLLIAPPLAPVPALAGSATPSTHTWRTAMPTQLHHTLPRHHTLRLHTLRHHT